MERKNCWLKILIIFGLFSLVSDIWILLELGLYGRTMPSEADTIIGIGFVVSLYYNLKHRYRDVF